MTDETERLCTALEHAMGTPPAVRDVTRKARDLAAENEQLREKDRSTDYTVDDLNHQIAGFKEYITELEYERKKYKDAWERQCQLIGAMQETQDKQKERIAELEAEAIVDRGRIQHRDESIATLTEQLDKALLESGR